MEKIFTVNMPDIGEGVIEGEVIQWLKQQNDLLSQDEPVVVVMTDKATVELPSPYPGRLIKQYYKVGQIAIKDQPLYDIEIAGEAVVGHPTSETPAQSVLPIPQPKRSEKTQPITPLTPPHTTALHKSATPPARKLARDLGVDINLVTSSGKEGCVTSEDVIHYHASMLKTSVSPALRLPGDREEPIVGIRNLMAQRMTESKATIPHFSYFEQVDATRLVQLRDRFKEEGSKQSIAVTYMPFIIKSLSMSLKAYPVINSSVDLINNKLIIHQHHNIGIAISTENGLIVPVLKDVQELTLPQVIIAYEELKQRALTNKLHSNDMKEATMTISNFGVLGGGGLWATPIINHPEIAILALSKIHKEPIVKNDNIAIRDVLNLSWSFDHRIIDGDLAATFSHYFSALLQNPAPLLP